MEKRIALVLSGGSIKGAFQAGAIKAFIDKGYQFSYIYGISVGSLNAAFISNEAGKQGVDSIDKLDWVKIGEELILFWKNNIKSPEDVAIKHNKLSTLGKLIFNNFNGLVDTKPIHSLVKKTIKTEILQKSPIRLVVGAVNVSDGEIVYSNPSSPNFIDYLLASTAIPIIMPIVYIGGNKSLPFLDGGIRDVAPLKQAIDAGADSIVCISCHSQRIMGRTFNTGSLISVAERVMDIIVNEIVNNDIEWANYINKYVPQDGSKEVLNGAMNNYRYVPIKVVKPSSPLTINLESFDSKDIEEAINSGYYSALEELK